VSSVWLTIPSARTPKEANPLLRKWAAMGYKIAIWRDGWDGQEMHADLWIQGLEYPGYAQAVNRLIKTVMERHADAEWFVIGGDDTLPDPNKKADEIAWECAAHFYYNIHAGAEQHRETFGIMQPTGDRYASGQIDRICGSAWIGREFAKRAYKGNGPLWPEYTHMFVDEELQEVAKRYGVLWQRPDLTQKHMHYMRESDAIDSGAIERRQPDHITHDGYTQEHWVKYQRLFLERRMAGFPESELL
jgi:hypothetical protein